jgi:ElaB/YqjD/DUF883 family membrane-anchored ribosome-binding protein
MPQVDDEHDDDPRRRASRTTPERLQMLESDTQSHARLISELLKASSKFSHEQMEQLRSLLREEFADAGIRLDGPDHVEEARADFRFIRRVRKGVDGYASKIGWFVIAAILAGAVWLFTLGMNTWKGGP